MFWTFCFLFFFFFFFFTNDSLLRKVEQLCQNLYMLDLFVFNRATIWHQICSSIVCFSPLFFNYISKMDAPYIWPYVNILKNWGGGGLNGQIINKPDEEGGGGEPVWSGRVQYLPWRILWMIPKGISILFRGLDIVSGIISIQKPNVLRRLWTLRLC